jgi:pentatricopeptide repeat protein
VLSNALIHAYAKCGDIDDAREVFDRIEERNVRTWNTMIGGLAQHGCGREAYELFLRMQRSDQPGISCVPDATTYVSILNPSCASEESFGDFGVGEEGSWKYSRSIRISGVRFAGGQCTRSHVCKELTVSMMCEE